MGGAEPVKIAVVAQQLVGLQQAGQVGVFHHVQPAGGGDRRPDTVHGQGQNQRAHPAHGGPAGHQRCQHDPQAHDKGPGPFGQQKAEEILPYRDLHGAPHKGGDALNGAGQGPQPESGPAVCQVHPVQQHQHTEQRDGKGSRFDQGGLQPSARQTAHQGQKAAVPLLPYQQQSQQQHGRQQDQVGEGIGEGGVQAFLRVVVDGNVIQPGVYPGGEFNVFQIVAGGILLENGDTRQLAGLGLYAVQKLPIPGHRIVFAAQLAEQPVVQGQTGGIQIVTFVFIFLFVFVKKGGVFLPVILQIDTVTVGQFPVIVGDAQQTFVFGQLPVEKFPFFFHGHAAHL